MNTRVSFYNTKQQMPHYISSDDEDYEYFEVPSGEETPDDMEELELHDLHQRGRTTRVEPVIDLDSGSDEGSRVPTGTVPDIWEATPARSPSPEVSLSTERSQSDIAKQDSPPRALQGLGGLDPLLHEAGEPFTRNGACGPGGRRYHPRVQKRLRQSDETPEGRFIFGQGGKRLPDSVRKVPQRSTCTQVSIDEADVE